MDLEGSGLFIAPEPLDWDCGAGRARRLQVNAFGFGGSNYVVQLEQAMDETATILVSPSGEPGLAREKGDGTSDFGFQTSDLKEDPDSAGEASGGHPELQGVSFLRARMGGRDYRMAVVAESEEEALTVIERSRHLAEGGILTPKILRSMAQQGVLMGAEDLPVLPLALVFPGQGAHYGGMGRDLYEFFPCHQRVDGSGCSGCGLRPPSLVVP